LDAGHSYAILDAKTNNNKAQVKMYDVMGHGSWKDGIDEKKNGIFWIPFEDFWENFSTLSICYGREWKEVRFGVDISWNHEKNELITPVLELTVPANGVVEWIGIFQQDGRVKNAPPMLDLSLFIYKQTQNGNIPLGFIPLQASRQNFFSNFGNDKIKEGKYLLVPYCGGLSWDAKFGATRGITITVHGYGFDNTNAMKIEIVDAFETVDKINNMFLDFVMTLGEKKQWQDLMRFELKVGQMTLFGGQNIADDVELTFKMKGKLENITNAFNHCDLSKECQWVLKPNDKMLFAVQMVKDPSKKSSASYKTGLQAN